MRATYTLSLMIFVLGASFFHTKAIAGNNKNFGVSTRAQTMGGAFTAVADDASAIFYNPAGLVQIKDFGFLNDAAGVMPASTYTNYINGFSESNNKAAFGPSSFIAKRVNKAIVLGMGLYAPFARVTSYPASLALMGFRVKSRTLQLSLAPVAAIALTKRLSFGLGPSFNYEYLSVSAFGLKQKADGYTVSGVFSLFYALTEKWKLGATYHTPTSVRTTGKGRGTFFMQPVHDGLIAKYRNPGYLDLGTSIQLSRQLLFAAGFGAEFWQNTKIAQFIYENAALTNMVNFNSHDSYNAHVGIEYRFKEKHALRLGYAYLQHAIPPEGIFPGVLDFDIDLFSAGYSYFYKQNWRFDLGVEIANAHDAVKLSPAFNPFVGLYQARLNTIWLGINYQV